MLLVCVHIGLHQAGLKAHSGVTAPNPELLGLEAHYALRRPRGPSP